MNCKQIRYSEVKNEIDVIVSDFAFVFDLNFKYSFEKVKEKDYINRIYRMLTIDGESKEKIDRIVKLVNEYIDEKIK